MADNNGTRTSALSIGLLVVFLIICISTGCIAHKKASQLRPIREEVPANRLVQKSRQVLAPDVIDRIPIIQYHKPEFQVDEGLREFDGTRERMCQLPPRRNTTSDCLWSWIKGTTALTTNVPTSTAVCRGESLSTCSICTEDFLDGMELRELPCGHAFHPQCIDPWLRERARTCPLWYGYLYQSHLLNRLLTK